MVALLFFAVQFPGVGTALGGFAAFFGQVNGSVWCLKQLARRRNPRAIFVFDDPRGMFARSIPNSYAISVSFGHHGGDPGPW